MIFCLLRPELFLSLSLPRGFPLRLIPIFVAHFLRFRSTPDFDDFDRFLGSLFSSRLCIAVSTSLVPQLIHVLLPSFHLSLGYGFRGYFACVFSCVAYRVGFGGLLHPFVPVVLRLSYARNFLHYVRDWIDSVLHFPLKSTVFSSFLYINISSQSL